MILKEMSIGMAFIMSLIANLVREILLIISKLKYVMARVGHLLHYDRLCIILFSIKG